MTEQHIDKGEVLDDRHTKRKAEICQEIRPVLEEK